MSIYGIYACEGMFQGLHGMNEYGFIECDSVDIANEYGVEWSDQVMSSYGNIEELAKDWAENEGYEEGTEEYEEAMNDFFLENQLYYIIKLRDDCPLTIKELNEREFDEFHELCKMYGEDEWDHD